MTTREALRRLIDELNDDEAERLLRTLEDPASRALALAPIDDEPLTEPERASIDDARRAYARGEWVPAEEVRREIGW